MSSELIDHELADARAQLVSKLFGLIDNLTVRAEALDHATLDRASPPRERSIQKMHRKEASCSRT